MAKIIDYPKELTLHNEDVFVVDGDNGTKGYLAKNLAEDFNSSISNGEFGNLNTKFKVNDLESIDYLMKYDKMLIGTESSGNVAGTVSDVTFALLDTLSNQYARRQCYRGKNLGSSVTQDQYEEINRGTFAGMMLGDYWQINDVTWRIVDFDYWLNTGDIQCKHHHLVIMPDNYLGAGMLNMNDTLAEAVYAGSKMRETHLKGAISSQVINAFGAEHILNHREYLVNAVSGSYPSGGAWYDSTVELPNEIMIFGNRSTTSPNGNENGTIDNTQLAAMKANPDLTYTTQAPGYWLRDFIITSDGYFFYFYTEPYGYLVQRQANFDAYIRPVFGLVRD